MSLIKNLFLGKKEKILKDSPQAEEKLSIHSIEKDYYTSAGKIIEIPKYNLIGNFHESPNKTYIIAWGSSGLEDAGGYKKLGKFIYVLLKQGKIILTGAVSSPYSCQVANNGFFVVNGSTTGTELQSIFYAFDNCGNQLIKHHIGANIYNMGISENGNYCTCQSCMSNNEDGNMLYFFELNKGELIWKSEAFEWANNYVFDLTNKTISLVMKDGYKYRYSFKGEFIDIEKWRTDRITRSKN